MSGILHVLFSPKAEGCPRLALDLLRQERAQHGVAGSVAFCTRAPDDLLAAFEETAAAVHFLGWRRRGYLALYRTARRLLTRTRPAGVVVYAVGQHVPVAAAARRLGIPAVLHLGNTPPEHGRAFFKLWAGMKAGDPFLRAYAACSSHVRTAAVHRYGLAPDKVAAVPNGIDLPRFAAARERRPAHGGARPRCEIGMVATLERHKDQATLLRGFHELRARGTDARLHVIGDGSRRDVLRSLAVELGVDTEIRWAGTVADVAGELARLDVFAFATTESEGLGIALVEALAAGLPVVASDVPACREVLRDGRWGRLVAGREPGTWADALADAERLVVPGVDEMSGYDVRDTFRAYARLLAAA